MSETKQHLRADYVIVGGGSAGLVLANRLTEDGTKKVVLVEAGGEARSFWDQLPAGYAKLVGNPGKDWQYEQRPDPTIGDRHVMWSAGRMLGGGSAINGQVYIRGTSGDFDYWADHGAPGWAYHDIASYFRKLERWHGEPDQVHGESGMLSVSPMRGPDPFAHSFLEACGESGLQVLRGYNDPKMEGAYLTVASQQDGWRCSTEKAYLRPARQRPNLTVVTRADVKSVRIESGRALGVLAEKNGKQIVIDAAREVIISAGAMGSPALLMRSGIGDSSYLKGLGIEAVHDLPGVGRNLQEHPCVRISKRVDRATLNSEGPLALFSHAVRYALSRSGPLSVPVVQGIALAKTREDLDEPDVQLQFLPFCADFDPETMQMSKVKGISIAVTLCHPESRGRVELTADGRPLVAHQFLSDDRDLQKLIDGCLLIEQIFAEPAFTKHTRGPNLPNPVPASVEGWASFVRETCSGAFHPVGTCKMGEDSQAVVDPQLRVHGLSGLRVVDASVMPRITSANTNATTIMIAERAADLIKAG
jgi:choline dehydrogenase